MNHTETVRDMILHDPESREKLIQDAFKAEDRLACFSISDETLVAIMSGAEILSFETIDAPMTDGYFLLISSPEYGILFVEISDLLSDADDPDALSQVIAARVCVYISGEKEVPHSD